jgi:hypothetical protein
LSYPRGKSVLGKSVTELLLRNGGYKREVGHADDLNIMEFDAHVVAAVLLVEFGHEVPQWPPAWFRKQQRQAPVRRALEGAARRRCQRRIYRWLFAPIVARLEDEAERLKEARAAWEDAGQIAGMLVAHARRDRAA